MKNANQLNGVDNYPTGESINQGALIVPYPGYAQKYIVFHKTAGLYQNYGASCNELLYSIVEYNSSNPLGSVIKRRVSLVKDTLDDACLTATKHANGRDWWVIVSEGNNIGYYIFLLTKYGINLHHKQVFVGKKRVEVSGIPFSQITEIILPLPLHLITDKFNMIICIFHF